MSKNDQQSLPYGLFTMSPDEQVEWLWQRFLSRESVLEKYDYLMGLQEQDKGLFFRLLSAHPEEMLPAIYTPAVGEVCQQHSQIYRKDQSLYLAYPERSNLSKRLDNLPKEGVKVVVITDGERILGLGDLGVGGIGISKGKLALYTLFGGLSPDYALPIHIDTGTDNQALLEDPHYLGWRHPRIRGEEYDSFVDQVVQGLKRRYPGVMIHWEDFSKANATPLLKKYREQIPSFNDDIQGTAGVVVSGVLSALQSLKRRVSDQRIVCFGAGSAGIGAADLLVQAMIEEGTPPEEAKAKIFVLGRHGLAHSSSAGVDDLKRPYAHPWERVAAWAGEKEREISLEETVRGVSPTILIGTSTRAGAFSESIVRSMAERVDRPIIFPLSNPTEKSEAYPEDLIRWTSGRAILATGSPFAPVTWEGATYQIGQCNNVYIFPGLGMGVLAARATSIPDRLFLIAAKVLSEDAPILRDPYGSLFPPISDVRRISQKIASAVAEDAVRQGISPLTINEIPDAIKEFTWDPNI
ncbi:MAG: oxaloacetate-decarboxylating malate dehydrogenase [Chlamydiota bacterium]|nr:oxaloacetate-decarboxylating malate dehydrogenase [Chlamydiota bacterium]